MKTFFYKMWFELDFHTKMFLYGFVWNRSFLLILWFTETTFTIYLALKYSSVCTIYLQTYLRYKQTSTEISRSAENFISYNTFFTVGKKIVRNCYYSQTSNISHRNNQKLIEIRATAENIQNNVQIAHPTLFIKHFLNCKKN